MNEKLLERKLAAAIKRLGGIALKLTSPTFTGLPDRLVLLPEGKAAFCELKSTGKKQTPLQKHVSAMLRTLGYEVGVVDSEAGLTDFIDLLSNVI